MHRSDQLPLLAQNCEAVIPEGGLAEKLALAEKERRPLIVKLGLDPTAPDIHLGHTVVLRKLRQFQDCGHRVVLIVGDFTARIGDPSGRSQTRPALSVAQIKKNAATYKAQALKILKRQNLSIRYNSEWLAKLKADDLLRLLGKATLAQVLAREDFMKRYKAGQGIGLHEMLYPLLQAQDSVAIRADIEIGGTDQTFNMLMGRELQTSLGMEAQIVITMPLLIGLDGKQKMSKSLGNYIGITETAANIYGKVMSLPDALILPYMRFASDIPEADIPKRQEDIRGAEMQLKQKLAFCLAALYTTNRKAEDAQQQFRATFQKREFPKDAKVLVVHHRFTLFDLVTEQFHLFPSKSEARRKFAEGAVRLNGKKMMDGNLTLNPAKGETLELQIGKLGFYRVTRQ